MSRLLPAVASYGDYLASPRDEGTYRAAVAEVCRRHGLPTAELRKYPGGSTIVFAVGRKQVVKFFEPIFSDAARTEATVLAHVHGRLAVPTPALHATGELEGWQYVVMQQLPGVSLAEAWAEITPAQRAALCARLGQAVAGLHTLPLPQGLPGPDWPRFVHLQAQGCREQQRAKGLEDHWLHQIPGFLAGHDVDALARPPALALLHTEIMREHVLVQRRQGRWALSGLFDFEPARVGDPEYELASVGVFLAGGEPALLRAFLRGYGYPEARLDEALPQRILLHALLHRFSNLRWYLDRLPPRHARTLHDLATEWFAGAGPRPGKEALSSPRPAE